MFFKLIFAILITFVTAKCPCDQCNKITEDFSDCKNPCQPTCQFPFRKPCPTYTCTEGCVCKSGYILKSEGGPCIEATKCERHCGPNQEYQECGKCIPTCSNPNPAYCTRQCITGCFCKSGFLFDESTNSCVTKCS